MKTLAQALGFEVLEEHRELIAKDTHPFYSIKTRFGKIVRRPEKVTAYQSILLTDDSEKQPGEDTLIELRAAQATRYERLTGCRPKARSPWGCSSLALESLLRELGDRELRYKPMPKLKFERSNKEPDDSKDAMLLAIYSLWPKEHTS